MKRATVLLFVLSFLMIVCVSFAEGPDDDWLGKDYDAGLEWDDIDDDAEEDWYGDGHDDYEGIGDDEDIGDPGSW